MLIVIIQEVFFFSKCIIHFHLAYFNFEVTLFIFETIIVVEVVNQVIKFTWIQAFLCENINTTMRNNKFGDYFSLDHYFTLFEL